MEPSFQTANNAVDFFTKCLLNFYFESDKCAPNYQITVYYSIYLDKN